MTNRDRNTKGGGPTTRVSVHMLCEQETDLAREWIAECAWPNIDADAAADLPDQSVWSGVQRHYAGGIDQFLSDIEAAIA